MAETSNRSAVTFQRGFADGRMLFEREGTHFVLTWEDVQQIVYLAQRCRDVQGVPRDETRARPRAPIARITLRDGYIVNTRTYSPSLPDGEHDLYCAPEATAPYMRAEETSGAIDCAREGHEWRKGRCSVCGIEQGNL